MPRWAFIVIAGAGLASLLLALINVWSGLGGGPQRGASSDPQHVHRGLVPRTGGFALALGILVGVALADIRFGEQIAHLWVLIAVSLPIFCAGMSEDMFGAVAARWRYYASLLSAALAFVVGDIRLERMDVALFDAYLTSMTVSFAATIFCIAGVAQAFNIVDGKNGLSSGSALIAFLFLAAAALSVRDLPYAALALACAGGALGFLVVNFPRGLIFLGDGGAYLLGYFVAILSVLMVQRQPNISAWFPLMVCAFPVLETLFSFARRLVIERQKFDEPDHLHLHSLIYRALFIRWRRQLPLWAINSLTALPILLAAAAVAWVAFAFRYHTGWLKLFAVGTAAGYLLVYVLLRWSRSRRARGRRGDSPHDTLA